MMSNIDPSKIANDINEDKHASSSLKQFLEMYEKKCNHFGEDPNPAVFQLVSGAIESGQTLNELCLEGTSSLLMKSRIQDDDIFALSESLAAFPNSPFLRVDLSLNEIENNGAKALSSMLKCMKTMKSLNLRSNAIGEIGGLAIAYALEGQNSLQKLDLNGNPIGDIGMAAIGKALLGNANTCLVELDVGNTDMGTNAVIQMARSLCTNTTLQVLNLENARQFSLEGETMLHLSKMLPKNKCLRTLNLSKHRIRDNAVEWLIQGLQQNASLKTLSLRANQIGPGGAQLLADYIRSGSCALEELNLAGNRLTDEGGVALAEALRIAADDSSCPLRSLDLCNCALSTPALVALAKALPRSGLHKLSLWGNCFEQTSATRFREVLDEIKRDIVIDFKPLIQSN